MIYYAKPAEIKNGENKWSYTKIEIFQKTSENVSEKIGEYIRNYPSYGEATFCPFELEGQWYALYSKDYTATRVMTLPDCQDLCGEERDSYGFCPTELFVPVYQEVIIPGNDTIASFSYKEFDEQNFKKDRPITFYNMALVSGCIWGDDSTWKIEAFDLSDLKNKNFKRFQPFGYLPLAPLPLKECVNFLSDSDDRLSITINTTKTFHKRKNTNSFSTYLDLDVIEKVTQNKYGDLVLKPKHFPDLEIYTSDKKELKNFVEVFEKMEIDSEYSLAQSFVGKTKSEAEIYFTSNKLEFIFINQEHEGMVSYSLAHGHNPNRFYCTLKKDTDIIYHVRYG